MLETPEAPETDVDEGTEEGGDGENGGQEGDMG
jgi:hypothetical protein